MPSMNESSGVLEGEQPASQAGLRALVRSATSLSACKVNSDVNDQSERTAA